MRKQTLIITFLILITAGFGFWKFQQRSIFQAVGQTNLSQATISVGNQTFTVEIAQSDEQKAAGLSNRPNLAPNAGMLFVFNPPSRPDFWMKDMRFNLDFIWISNGQVVDITHNVPAPKAGTTVDDLPKYVPNQNVDYVLEISAGTSATIKIGDKVIVSSLKTS